MTRYGIEVTEGKSVDDTEDNDKLYSSEFQSPKLHKVFKSVFTAAADGSATVSIPHGLTYAPLVLAYYKGPDGYWRPMDNAKVALTTSNYDIQILADPGGLTANTQYTYKIWTFLDPAEVLV